MKSTEGPVTVLDENRVTISTTQIGVNQFDHVWNQFNQSDYLCLRVLNDAAETIQAA